MLFMVCMFNCIKRLFFKRIAEIYGLLLCYIIYDWFHDYF
ncbi:hypothetical protein LTSEMIS_0288 [Salmonella enterica subsp. enterica serovar Mississippi str. A4-633]|nr:hypothetical protein LTSEMIS_0288 [Salmonella enterica subsp. enterica serovar Mississippi str. A4-633]